MSNIVYWIHQTDHGPSETPKQCDTPGFGVSVAEHRKLDEMGRGGMGLLSLQSRRAKVINAREITRSNTVSLVIHHPPNCGDSCTPRRHLH